MVFNVSYVNKLEKTYIISGRLSYTLDDYGIFSEIRESYRLLMENGTALLGSHLILREDYIEYQRMNLETVAGVLNVFKQNLNAKILFKFADDCEFDPQNAEPLVKMQARKLLKL